MLAIDLLVLIIGLGLYALLVVNRQGSPQSMAMPSEDASVTFHPRTLPISGILSDGREVTGTFYPTLPGPNTLHLVVRGATQVLSRTDHLDLTVTMPGMHMVPARVQLAARDSGYSGIVRLPMFGFYQARVSLGTPTGSVSGMIRIAVPLPRV